MADYKEEKTNTWRVIYRYTDWIESCHALGLKVNVWTVNKKEDMQYFWDKVDFITTDEPLGLLKDIMKVK